MQDTQLPINLDSFTPCSPLIFDHFHDSCPMNGQLSASNAVYTHGQNDARSVSFSQSIELGSKPFFFKIVQDISQCEDATNDNTKEMNI